MSNDSNPNVIKLADHRAKIAAAPLETGYRPSSERLDRYNAIEHDILILADLTGPDGDTQIATTETVLLLAKTAGLLIATEFQSLPPADFDTFVVAYASKVGELLALQAYTHRGALLANQKV